MRTKTYVGDVCVVVVIFAVVVFVAVVVLIVAVVVLVVVFKQQIGTYVIHSEV